MKFEETRLKGAYLVSLEERSDDRGFFARAFCRDEFEALGLNQTIAQSNLAYTKRRGTLRGMHYQVPPYAEVKLIRCTRGAIFDVMVDLRPESETFGQWFGAELTADNRRMLYVPESFGHGYLSLTDDVEVFYHVSAPYAPGAESGFRYDDPRFGIEWPIDIEVVSDKDRSWPDFQAP